MTRWEVNISTRTWEHVQILPAQLHGFSDNANRCLQTVTKSDSSQSFRIVLQHLLVMLSSVCVTFTEATRATAIRTDLSEPRGWRAHVNALQSLIASTHLLYKNKRRSRKVVRFLTCVCFGARSMQNGPQCTNACGAISNLTKWLFLFLFLISCWDFYCSPFFL